MVNYKFESHMSEHCNHLLKVEFLGKIGAKVQDTGREGVLCKIVYM